LSIGEPFAARLSFGFVRVADRCQRRLAASDLLVTLSRKLHGEAAKHAEDAIRAGKPDVLTIDRTGAAANRRTSTGSLDAVPGKHLDEYPPAMFKEGGVSASVRPINPRDNMSAGACIGNACRGLPDGTQVRIRDRGLSMTSTTVNVEVAYGQIAIFTRALQQPFNDWTDRHVAQGFAWRPGSVSFRTIVEAGRHSVEINVTEHVGPISVGAVRAIEVPFEVPADGAIEVGSISDSVPLSLPAGVFLLRCEFLRPSHSGAERVRLVFGMKDASHFAIVRADESLNADGELLMTAPAALG